MTRYFYRGADFHPSGSRLTALRRRPISDDSRLTCSFSACTLTAILHKNVLTHNMTFPGDISHTHVTSGSQLPKFKFGAGQFFRSFGACSPIPAVENASSTVMTRWDDGYPTRLRAPSRIAVSSWIDGAIIVAI